MQVNKFDKWDLLNYEHAVKTEELKRVSDVPEYKKLDKAVTVSISQEGLRALHGQKLHGAVDMSKRREEEQIFKKLSYNPADEHLWALRGEVTDALTALKEKQDDYSLDDILSIRFEAYANQYDALKKAYAEGTRDVWVCDGLDENGELKYHQLTEEEDLACLEEGFAKMQRGIINTLGVKKQAIKIKEVFYNEHIDIDVPENYQEKMMDILERTVAKYKELKENGEDASITKIIQKYFNEDRVFANAMRELYGVSYK